MAKVKKISVKNQKKCECCGSEIEVDLKKLLIDAKNAGIKLSGVCKNCQNAENVTYTDINIE